MSYFSTIQIKNVKRRQIVWQKELNDGLGYLFAINTVYPINTCS